MSLKTEPTSEPLHISVKNLVKIWLFVHVSPPRCATPTDLERTSRFRVKIKQLESVQGRLPESQGQNLALTV